MHACTVKPRTVEFYVLHRSIAATIRREKSGAENRNEKAKAMTMNDA